MKKNIRLIIIPPVVGGIVAALALVLIQQALEKFYFPYDPDPVFAFSVYDYLLFDSLFFLLALIPAIIFQLLIAIPIYKRYQSGTKVFYLGMWPFVIICCLIFGLALSYFNWSKIMGIEKLLLKAGIVTWLAITYWVINLNLMNRIQAKILAAGNKTIK